MSRIAFAGLGVMGGGMVRRLLDRGHEVAVWNRSAERAEALTGVGARPVDTPAALGADEPDLTLISVADGASVEQVVFGTEGLAETLPSGSVLANLSTVDPAWSREFAAQLDELGITLLETTVLGNDEHAAAGELRIYVAGPEAAAEAARPVLADLGKEVSLVGGYGAATTVKIALNLLMGVQLEALAEAVVIAERSGIDTEVIVKAIADSGYCSPVMRFKTRAVLAERWEQAHFRLDLMRKDLALAESVGARVRAELPAVTASRTVLDAAISKGLGHLDCAAVVAHSR